ncbi:CDP-diacylglycerol--serine O-phosphatidyltransferase [Alkalibacter saccharofermentans]|uniref:CDP-diacylglycerol--serine O-phosphatidyltransferase n=1 Tax=Alkalibacter saccharofermentans DSM 14828 TaxID=1120975 RepID=A0A1M4VYS9_9FIRM|nr:CDP-diacylglycerol--serine O-phosphatidyltransferase [Alkalibacter saccharofermentans]SHE74060.1 CDP-diacylglycerol---serine O-phosphatidyltransferase [Alkalibacter saccharofermentans DSM 14828]
MIKNLPNIMTMINISLGSLAVILLLDNNHDGVLLPAAFIIAGGIIDGLDGKVARWLKAESEMGKQLDSLADLITFGIAPVCLFISTDLLSLGVSGYSALIFYPVCGAFRLARYNVESCNKSFTGVPITVCGMSLAVLRLACESYHVATMNLSGLLAVVIFICSLLMISRIKVPRLNHKNCA